VASTVSPLLVSVLLSACGGNDGEPGTSGGNGINALVTVSAEPSGAHCASGGSKIEAGLDADGNGTLGAAEVSSTQYACDGVVGSSGRNTLVRVFDEPSGSHCAAAGKAISVGIDNDANGVLDAGEVSATSYICNGGPGVTLSWVIVTRTAVQAQPNKGYVASNDAAQVVVTLPANPAIGDIVRAIGAGLGGWKIAQNAGQAVDTTRLGGRWTARESGRDWNSVASSADGSKLVAAVSGGQIYTSTDSGVMWTAHESNRNWISVASSADGSKLVAVVSGGQIYTSTDSGLTWAARGSVRNWSWVASSADGSKLVATEWAGPIYTSTDSGITWTPRDASRGWNSVASSADGGKLVAVEWAGQIYTSTDSGVSWTPRESNRSWGRVASSADGSKLVADEWAGKIYVSSDSGVSWTPRESNRSWTSLASSVDGSKLAAAVYTGQIYTSSDSGASWTPHEPNRSWASVASSGDGSKLVAVEQTGQIYTSPPSTTTSGTGGSISGSLSDAIELIYLGNGLFNVLSHEGDLTVQ
jgi:hypothetical protein